MLWAGIVFGGICLYVCVCASVHLYDCSHKISKTTDQKSM